MEERAEYVFIIAFVLVVLCYFVARLATSARLLDPIIAALGG